MFAFLLRIYFLIKSKKFHAYINSEKYKKASFDFLNKHFHEELKRFQVEQVGDIITCVDVKSNTVVACIQLMTPEQLKQTTSFETAYQKLNFIPDELYNDTIIVDAFVIAKEYRKHLGIHFLLFKKYIEIIRGKYILSVAVCEPVLFPYYKKLGFIAAGKIFQNKYGGFYLPLIKKNCDILPSHTVIFSELKLNPLKWQKEKVQLVEKIHEEKNIGSRFLNYDEIKNISSPILNNINLKSRINFFQNSICILLKKNQTIIAKIDGAYTMMLIKSGQCRINLTDSFSVILSPGDIVGELAFFTRHGRTANVIAIENTEVIILSLNCIKNIKDIKNKSQFFENMTTFLCERIVKTSFKISTQQIFTIDKATNIDVNFIFSELKSEALLDISIYRRSKDNIQANIKDFFLVKDSAGSSIGFAALHVYNNNLAEIQSITVIQKYRSLGVGALLIKKCIEEAEKLDIKNIFVATKHDKYFSRFGFKIISKSEISPLIIFKKLLATFRQPIGHWLPNISINYIYMIKQMKT